MDEATLPRPNRIPVSLITGFLGSGKTTLLRHLVDQPGMESTALIINEIGEVGLDHLLVESAIENILLLENGCICCSIRGDLIDTISDLFAKVQNRQIPAFGRILIETTGLADPTPIVLTLQSDEAVVRRCHLDCVTTLVDGVQGAQQIKQYEEVVSQVAQADVVLVSKADLCDEDGLQGLHNEILGVNPAVGIANIVFGEIDPDVLFGARDTRRPVAEADDRHDRHDHDHDHNVGDDLSATVYRHGNIFTCSLVHKMPLDATRLKDWLTMIYSLRPYSMLRLKGLVRLADSDHPLLLQAVGGVVSPPQWLPAWPDGEPETRLVLIFKNLAPQAVGESFQRHVVEGR